MFNWRPLNMHLRCCAFQTSLKTTCCSGDDWYILWLTFEGLTCFLFSHWLSFSCFGWQMGGAELNTSHRSTLSTPNWSTCNCSQPDWKSSSWPSLLIHTWSSPHINSQIIVAFIIISWWRCVLEHFHGVNAGANDKTGNGWVPFSVAEFKFGPFFDTEWNKTLIIII